jgi:hypothetical protein
MYKHKVACDTHDRAEADAYTPCTQLCKEQQLHQIASARPSLNKTVGDIAAAAAVRIRYMALFALLLLLLLLTADGMKLLALLRMPPPTPGLPGVRWLSSTFMPGVGSSSLVLPGVAAPGVPAVPRAAVAAAT